MDDQGFQWRITAENSVSSNHSTSRQVNDSITGQPLVPPLVGYKPSLTVDVAAAENGVAPISTSSPQPGKTPHVATNIFVAGLPTPWGDEELREHYKAFGEIISTKVVKNKHFGFVMFKTPEAAHKAINSTHLSRPTPTSHTLLHVSIAMHDEGVDEAPCDRIFVRGLPQWATKDHLSQCFSAFGTVVECAVLMNPLGQCKGSGFVQFTSVEEATAAVDARDTVRIENWDSPLDVKYSETLEVRHQRQERNRNRQKIWANSPKYRGNSMGGNMGPPSGLAGPPSLGATSGVMGMNSPQFPFYHQQMPMLPSPQPFPMVSPAPFPIAYAQPSPPSPQQLPPPPPPPPPPASSVGQLLRSPSVAERPTRIIYPQPTSAHFFPGAGMMVMEPPPLPLKGDLHFSGRPVTEEVLRILLQPFGIIEAMKSLEEEEGGGIAVRMKSTSQHPHIAQSLNGTLFSTGDILAVGLYA